MQLIRKRNTNAEQMCLLKNVFNHSNSINCANEEKHRLPTALLSVNLNHCNTSFFQCYNFSDCNWDNSNWLLAYNFSD